MKLMQTALCLCTGVAAASASKALPVNHDSALRGIATPMTEPEPSITPAARTLTNCAASLYIDDALFWSADDLSGACDVIFAKDPNGSDNPCYRIDYSCGFNSSAKICSPNENLTIFSRASSGQGIDFSVLLSSDAQQPTATCGQFADGSGLPANNDSSQDVGDDPQPTNSQQPTNAPSDDEGMSNQTSSSAGETLLPTRLMAILTGTATALILS